MSATLLDLSLQYYVRDWTSDRHWNGFGFFANDELHSVAVSAAVVEGIQREYAGTTSQIEVTPACEFCGHPAKGSWGRPLTVLCRGCNHAHYAVPSPRAALRPAVGKAGGAHSLTSSPQAAFDRFHPVRTP